MIEIEGTYVFRFSGFDRHPGHARHLIGLGSITLKANGDYDGEVTSGSHYATNSQMWGHGSAAYALRHSEYKLSGAYRVEADKPPRRLKLHLTFTRDVVGSSADREAMTDTMLLLQCGADRYWVISTNARDGRNDVIDELVIGEAIKVDGATW